MLTDKQLIIGEMEKSNETPIFSSANEMDEYSRTQEKLRVEGFELDGLPEAHDFFKYIYDFYDLNADTIDVFQCPKCHHVCKQMSKMRTHILHGKIFVCLQCGRTFKRVGAVRQHVQKIHVR